MNHRPGPANRFYFAPILGFSVVLAGLLTSCGDPSTGRSSRANSPPAVDDVEKTEEAATQNSKALEPNQEHPDQEHQGKLEPDQQTNEPITIPENRLLDPPANAEEETQAILDTYVGPDQLVRESMSPPPDCKSLGIDNHLWIDRKNSRVIADGYVAMRQGVLEMFACPMGTKEHESVVATLAKPSEVHAALLSIGATPGTPVQFVPTFVAATGQVIRVWVCWRDDDGSFQSIDARQWIRNVKSEQPMIAEWVFAGSGFWKDPSNGREYYQADSGDMICVSNFSTAMLDVSIASSAEADNLLFKPATDSIPERGTPVRLVLVSIPNPTDAKNETEKAKQQAELEAKKTTPPPESILPPLKQTVPEK